MKLLGIDHGDAKVGLATGDTESGLASPYGIIKNKDDGGLLDQLTTICDQERIEGVVVGLPLNYKNGSSKQVDRIKAFTESLAETLEIEVFSQDEQLTTQHAKRLAGSGDEDDIAAMLILQAYLDANK